MERSHTGLAAACVLLLIVLVGAPSGSVARAQPVGLVMRVLDVGEGDATWISTATQNIVVDCGSASFGKQLVLTLQAARVSKLDVLAVSDTRPERAGGCAELVRAMRPDTVLLAHNAGDTTAWSAFITTLNRLSIQPQGWIAGSPIVLRDDVVATIWSPASADAARLDDGDTLAMTLDYAGARILFADDAGRVALSSVGPVRVLKLSSHANGSVLANQLLAVTEPEWIVTSQSRTEIEPGPDPRLLTLAEDAVATRSTYQNHYLSTARNGNIALFISLDAYGTAGISAATDR